MASTMSKGPPPRNLQPYVEAEREARLKLARFKAKLYASPQLHSPVSSRRMTELERRWEAALKRLREAKKSR